MLSQENSFLRTTCSLRKWNKVKREERALRSTLRKSEEIKSLCSLQT
jgi:hypothetical protein